MTLADPPDELPVRIIAALDRLTRAQRAHRRVTAERLGLTPLQIELLRTLAGGVPPVPVIGQLAAEVAVSQPTVTDSIRTLERKGLIVRRRDPADARRTRVVLTAVGLEVASAVEASDEHLVDAVAGLNRGQQETTLETLLALIARLVETGTITVTRTCLTCRFHEPTGPTGHHCTLLASDLPVAELRVNCAEHQHAKA